MDIDFKWFAIMLIVILAVGMLALSMGTYTKSLVNLEAAKAGLEKCPNLYGRQGDTIWVKNCATFIMNTKGSK